MTPPLVPLPIELRRLLLLQSSLSSSIAAHSDLLSRLQSLLAERAIGNKRMDLPVDLGMGWLIEGVVQDTAKIFIRTSFEPEQFEEMEVEKAEVWVKWKLGEEKKKLDDIEPQIEKLKKDFDVVKKTLRKALGEEEEEEEEVAMK